MINPSRLRVVFHTNVVLAAMLFRSGRLGWLRAHWHAGGVIPLASRATIAEFRRVLGCAKFGLQEVFQLEVLAFYASACTLVDPAEPCAVLCRDVKDQIFLDLAQSGKANLLFTRDEDLLALAGRTQFLIETPEAYKQRFPAHG